MCFYGLLIITYKKKRYSLIPQFRISQSNTVDILADNSLRWGATLSTAGGLAQSRPVRTSITVLLPICDNPICFQTLPKKCLLVGGRVWGLLPVENYSLQSILCKKCSSTFSPRRFFPKDPGSNKLATI